MLYHVEESRARNERGKQEYLLSRTFCERRLKCVK